MQRDDCAKLLTDYKPADQIEMPTCPEVTFSLRTGQRTYKNYHLDFLNQLFREPGSINIALTTCAREPVIIRYSYSVPDILPIRAENDYLITHLHPIGSEKKYIDNAMRMIESLLHIKTYSALYNNYKYFMLGLRYGVIFENVGLREKHANLLS